VKLSKPTLVLYRVRWFLDGHRRDRHRAEASAIRRTSRCRTRATVYIRCGIGLFMPARLGHSSRPMPTITAARPCWTFKRDRNASLATRWPVAPRRAGLRGGCDGRPAAVRRSIPAASIWVGVVLPQARTEGFSGERRDLRLCLEPPGRGWLPWMRGLGYERARPARSGLGMSELA
jgi:hypothetical protein